MPFRSSSIQSKLLPSDDDCGLDFSTSQTKSTSNPNSPSRPSIDTAFLDLPSLFHRPDPISPTFISSHPCTSPTTPLTSTSYFPSHAWWNKNKFLPINTSYTPPLEPILEYEINKEGMTEWMSRESRAKIEVLVTASLGVGLFVLVMWCVSWGTGTSGGDARAEGEFYGRD
ncbi:hypothetical protein B0J14DRAFT_99981 [Halenospora varia]|nr:hypothetical protein B0J14DRAFT_99981 [Halenospora varia]